MTPEGPLIFSEVSRIFPTERTAKDSSCVLNAFILLSIGLARAIALYSSAASSAAALVFYLPGVCTHTDTEGKQRKPRVRKNLKSFEKTQYLMNTLYISITECFHNSDRTSHPCIAKGGNFKRKKSWILILFYLACFLYFFLEA